MSALFRAAAAVLASCALGAGTVYATRALEGRGVDLFAGASETAPATRAPGASSDFEAVLVSFTEGRGARTARLDAVAEACGGTFVLRRGDVAGVAHVIAFIAEETAGESVEVRRLSAPGDLMRAEAGGDGLRLTSPDGFEGLAWALSSDAEARALGATSREALNLACVDAATAAARFNARAGEGEAGAADTALR